MRDFLFIHAYHTKLRCLPSSAYLKKTRHNDRGNVLTTDNNKTTSTSNNGGQSGLFSRFLATVEWLGNLLPHPVTLFALLSLFIVVLSGILGYFDFGANVLSYQTPSLSAVKG